MEPRQQGLSGGHETTPAAPGEYGFGRSPEKPANGGEKYEQKSPEVGTVQAEAAQVAMPALPTPVIATPDPATALVSDDTPSAAGDDDLIEKEWVDSAKKIIETTKDDPYARERQVNKLQVDYLQKRYGKKLGSSE